MDKKNLGASLTLYGLTDRKWVLEKLEREGRPATEENLLAGLLRDVRSALDGGVTFLQMREKDPNLTDDELLREAVALRDLCREYDVPFVIDNDVELALRSGADGVHVGQSDMACTEARRLLGPDRIVGVTARTPEQARKAQADGADYLGVGAQFRSGSKHDTVVLTADTVRAIADAVELPFVGIGGITKDNVQELAGRGLSGVAVIGGILGNKDIEEGTKELKETVVKALGL